MQPITHPAVPDTADAAGRHRPAPELPTVRRMLVEPLELLTAVPVAGPPAILIAGPLVLFALMLTGPFLALLTIVVAMMVAVMIAALAAAVVASPYLLVHHVRGRRAAARGSDGALSVPQLAPAGRRGAIA